MAEKKDLFASLQKTLKDVNRANRPLNHPVNLVGKVVEFGKKTITVEVQNGPLKDQTIEIIPGGTKVSEFKDESTETTASYTKIGGFIRFDGVAKVDGEDHYKARWANRFLKEAENAKGDFVMNDVLARVYRQGAITTRTGSKIPRYRMNILDADKTELVESPEAFAKKLTECFDSVGGALIFGRDGIEINEQPIGLPLRQEGDTFVRADPQEFATTLVDGMDDEFLEAVREGRVSVAPMRSSVLGTRVCEGIAKAIDDAKDGKPPRIMTVNLNAYEPEGLGLRLSYALSTNSDGEYREGITKELAERLRASFLETARPEDRDALAKDGWRGVSDTAITEFFAANGVEVVQPGNFNWNVTTVLARPFKDNPSEFMVLKSHEMARTAKPFPVQVAFLKDARDAHLDQMRMAVIEAVSGPVKKAEAEAPAADKGTKQDAAPVDDPDNEGEEKSIDSLLGEIPEDAMDLS